jgi:hypothetical protein
LLTELLDNSILFINQNETYSCRETKEKEKKWIRANLPTEFVKGKKLFSNQEEFSDG